MALVTVVVPIYNVAPYVEACLDSIAGQTHRDLDVVLVDDGSTDGSDRIAAGYVERDDRFRLHRQPNGGLGNARNTGIGLARGDYLAFVDSDDVLAPDAYERLLGSLVETGSDFATGRFRRLTAAGSRPAYFAARAFSRDRRGTHIRRFHELAVDRTAWNKLFRRSFWDAHGFRFGEGVTYEDQYATLPAHFRAEAVDVHSATVYHWRIREGGGTSISQRRELPREVLDRVAAVAATSRFLAQASPADKAWYEHTALRLDLGYAPRVLIGAGPAERAALLGPLQDWFAQTDPTAKEGLSAAHRLAWELIGRGEVDDLATLLDHVPAAGRTVRARHRVGGGWVADLPLQDRLPRALFRVDDELDLVATVTGVECADDTVVAHGRVGFATYEPVRRPRRRISAWLSNDRDERIDLAVTSAAGGTFTATASLRRIVEVSPGDTTWTLRVGLHQLGLARQVMASPAGPPVPAAPVTRPVSGPLIRLETARAAGLRVHVESATETLTAAVVEGYGVRLRGASSRRRRGPAELLLAGSDERRLRVSVEVADDGWQAVVPLEQLSAGIQVPTAPQGCRRADAVHWTMTVVGGGERHRVWHATADEPIWSDGRREVVLAVNGAGVPTLLDRRRRPLLTGVDAEADGLVLDVVVPTGVVPQGYVALGPGGAEQDLVQLSGDAGSARLLVPVNVLASGPWRLCWRDPEGPTSATHLGVLAGFLERPVGHPVRGVAVLFGRDRAGAPVVALGARGSAVP